MQTNTIIEGLKKIVGNDAISTNSEILKDYSRDLSFFPEKAPICAVWPLNTSKIEAIVKLANESNFFLIPISSKPGKRHHGDTIPQEDNTVILDLSKMEKILDINRKYRVIRIEPGVTFGKLIPELEKCGLKLNAPLLPRETKSVVTSALEREPVVMARHQWDTSDPLLCTEVVFGTGDLFRTGSAAGPGTLKQQEKAGQAHVNPMGPTQFSPFRIIQGAQGSMGVVTWATIKCELLPAVQKVYHLQSSNLPELLGMQHDLVKYRLCDEILILNDLNLACLVKEEPGEIETLEQILGKWNLIFVASGRGPLGKEKIEYLDGDIKDLLKEHGILEPPGEHPVKDHEILGFLNATTKKPWKSRYTGAYQDIFFLSRLQKVPDHVSLVESMVECCKLGIYIQPQNQGTSCHCEFDLYYDGTTQSTEVESIFLETSKKLIDQGAFFNRPYGPWKSPVFEEYDELNKLMMRKVKNIFDPKGVLNPGVLCFKEGEQ